MAVDKHPSRKPSPPRKPPAVGVGVPGDGKRESGQEGVPYGAKNEYEHSDEHGQGVGYGHRMRHEHVGGGEHTSEFPGGNGFPKAGDQSDQGE